MSSQKASLFILHLHDDLHLSVSAIKGYLAMLNSYFKFKGFNLAGDVHLKALIKAFQKDIPRRTIKVPNWNLDVVLRYLASDKFEPLKHSSFKSLTMKTLFLTALASAHRISELQAVSAKVLWQDGDAILSYLDEFVAKTETTNNPIPREFSIKSLARIVGEGDIERVMCPARALAYYIRRTREIPNRPRNLFVSVKRNSRPLSKNALSFFIRELIVSAHRDIQEEHLPMFKVKAHSVRGVATSLNFWRNRSLPQVISAATWKTASVFANHYLKDVSRFAPDEMLYSLGPIVAGGAIVAHSERSNTL